MYVMIDIDYTFMEGEIRKAFSESSVSIGSIERLRFKIIPEYSHSDEESKA